MLRFILYTLFFWVLFSLFSSFLKKKKGSNDVSEKNLLEDENLDYQSKSNCERYLSLINHSI